MLTPHIQDGDMYPSLPVQIWSLSYLASLATDLNPFSCLVPEFRLLEDRAGAMWKRQRPYTEAPKSIIRKLLYLIRYITVLFS